MTSLDYHICPQLSWEDTAALSSDTVNGFASISDHLDQVGCLPEIGGARTSDILAIALGWAVLGLVIYYPAIQIVAIVAAAIIFAAAGAVRSLMNSLPILPLRLARTSASGLFA